VRSIEFDRLAEVLRRNGLAHEVERPFPNDGWSGASLTLLERGGRRFVLKRDSSARDWIARATADGPILREAWFAAHGPALPDPLRKPYLGVGMDGDEFGMLMPDLTGTLLDWNAPVSRETLDRVLSGLARLHAHPWTASGELDGGLWCPLRERVTLICRASLEQASPARDAVGDRILPGWDAFARQAPKAARDLVDILGKDPKPLLGVLERVPQTLIHGDLKLANIGVSPDGSIDLVDWQMVSVAPVGLELGWFLVANVASLPLPPDEILDRYVAKLRHVISERAGERTGVGGDPTHDWDEQVDAAMLVGLLLRGWRKGYDAEAGITHPSGIGAAADLAWWCDRALEAADRIL
jgi:hypothetical protein